eukprot:SAG22_NODE_1467_length_4349_cov_3.654353_6_plen_141_part_00
MTGPTLAGLLAARVGLQPSFFLAVAMFAIGVVVVLLLLRELRDKSALPKFDWRQVVPLVTAAMMVRTPLARRFGVMLAAGAMSFGVFTIFALYLTDLYGYDPVLNGYWQSANFASVSHHLLPSMTLFVRSRSLHCFPLRS